MSTPEVTYHPHRDPSSWETWYEGRTLYTHGLRITPLLPGTFALSLPYFAVIEGRIATAEEVEAAKQKERDEIERSKPYGAVYYQRRFAALEDPATFKFSPQGDGRVWCRCIHEIAEDLFEAEKIVKAKREEFAAGLAEKGSA